MTNYTNSDSTSGGTVHCECDHLTPFVGVINRGWTGVSASMSAYGRVDEDAFQKTKLLLLLLVTIFSATAALFAHEGGRAGDARQRRALGQRHALKGREDARDLPTRAVRFSHTGHGRA